MIFDKTRRTYSFIQWGLFVFVLMCPFLSFAQGFINYQAFIYEKVKIVQPGRDMEQMVPYAKFPVNVLVKLITKMTLCCSKKNTMKIQRMQWECSISELAPKTALSLIIFLGRVCLKIQLF